MNNTAQRIILKDKEVQEKVREIADTIFEQYGRDNSLALAGIYTRGAYLARRIHARLEELTLSRIPLGFLDINLYRDDLTTLREQPVIRSTDIPYAVAGQRIVLIDDVIYTGRTVRAALEALLDFGRPSSVILAALVDRGWREYPIQPDITGMNIETKQDECIELHLEEVDGHDILLLKPLSQLRHDSDKRKDI